MKWKKVHDVSDPRGEFTPFELETISRVLKGAQTAYTAMSERWRETFAVAEFPDGRLIVVVMELPSADSIMAVIKERSVVTYVEFQNVEACSGREKDYHAGTFSLLRKRLKYALLALPAPDLAYKLDLVLKKQLMSDDYISQARAATLLDMEKKGKAWTL